MTKGTILTIFGVVGILTALIMLYGIKQELKPSQTAKELKGYQQLLDSTKAYYNVKIDSIDTANLILKSKIKDKNEIIYTLKSLVNDNNKKYQVITDSALVVEFERLRGMGIR